jgi:hypothetical protein
VIKTSICADFKVIKISRTYICYYRELSPPNQHHPIHLLHGQWATLGRVFQSLGMIAFPDYDAGELLEGRADRCTLVKYDDTDACEQEGEGGPKGDERELWRRGRLA